MNQPASGQFEDGQDATTTVVIRFYLVRDSGGRVCWLVAVTGEGLSQRVYGWVPDLDAFVANDPLSVDIQIDREMVYEPLTAQQATSSVEAGLIRRLADDQGLHDLLQVMRDEPRRLERTVLFGGPGSRVERVQEFAQEIAEHSAELNRRLS